jgi:hypothetical protein
MPKPLLAALHQAWQTQQRTLQAECLSVQLRQYTAGNVRLVAPIAIVFPHSLKMALQVEEVTTQLCLETGQ